MKLYCDNICFNHLALKFIETFSIIQTIYILHVCWTLTCISTKTLMLPSLPVNSFISQLFMPQAPNKPSAQVSGSASLASRDGLMFVSFYACMFIYLFIYISLSIFFFFGWLVMVGWAELARCSNDLRKHFSKHELYSIIGVTGHGTTKIVGK